jgi:hypothetical protein
VRRRARDAKWQIDGSKGPFGAATAIILPLDMTNHLALIKNERRYEYRRRFIAVEKLWRDAQVGNPLWQGVAKAAFATNDSGRYWRLSGAGGDWSEERNASSASRATPSTATSRPIIVVSAC